MGDRVSRERNSAGQIDREREMSTVRTVFVYSDVSNFIRGFLALAVGKVAMPSHHILDGADDGSLVEIKL